MLDFLLIKETLAVVGTLLVFALVMLPFWNVIKAEFTRCRRSWRKLPLFGKIALPVVFSAFYLYGGGKPARNLPNRTASAGEAVETAARFSDDQSVADI